jgi:hypothetical protein
LGFGKTAWDGARIPSVQCTLCWAAFRNANYFA